MLVRIITGALVGVDAHRVDVEVDATHGLPRTLIIGLPDSAVREAADRVRSALTALPGSGLQLGNARLTVSLAPADLRKTGAGYDLPIAVGVLAAYQQLPAERLEGLAFAGELGLDGTLRPIRGALALAQLARDAGLRGLVVPRANAAEAAVVDGLDVYGADHLQDVVSHVRRTRLLPATPPTPLQQPAPSDGVDLTDVRGQLLAKRALELAAGGGHHLLMVGPPGTGKTMLARRLPGLLPPLSVEEAVEVTRVYSAAGLLGERPLVDRRPFRAPHHTATQAALVGGGHHHVRVGELSLAHRGVLFLDEVAEMARPILDALRQPLESGVVQITRSGLRVELPARSQLVVALNPCPCGWRWEGAAKECVCPPTAAERYLARLSGPLLDRIDLQVGVDPVPLELMRRPPEGPTSEEVRGRVVRALEVQRRRWRGRRRPPLNAWMTPADTRRHCRLAPELETRLLQASQRLGLSARGLDRVLRVARTAADLAGVDTLRLQDLLEALSFRQWESRLGGELPTPHPRTGRRPEGAPPWVSRTR